MSSTIPWLLLVSSSAQIFRNKELLLFLCSANGIFKNDNGFLAAARGVFPSSEFLDLSPGGPSWKCGDEQCDRSPLLFVAVSHVFHLLVHSLRRHLGWGMDVLTHIHDVDTTHKHRLTQGRKHCQLQMSFFIVALKRTAKRSDQLLKCEQFRPQDA